MFCPECRAEYRSGFTRCTDCDAELVPELPQPQANLDCSELKHVWTGKDQDRCLSLCKEFKAAGIPFKVEQSRHQYLQGMDEKYRISVPGEFFQKSRRIVGPSQSPNR